MKILFKIFLRSFLLQAVWSYERMQSLGFLYAIFPKLKELYKDDANELRKSCQRHTGYFNTHPYMAPFILGTAARQEEKIKENQPDAVANLNRFKLQMAGPLAAIGDKIFWSTWRPLIGLLGVFLVFAGVRPYWLIPVIFIAVYNVPIVWHRWKVLYRAYRDKSMLTEAVVGLNKNMLLKAMPTAGLITVLLCICMAALRWGYAAGVLLLGFTALIAVLRKYFMISATVLVYMVTLVIVAGSLIIG